MLQLNVPRCRIGNNLGGVVDSERTYHTPQAHLSALWMRQAHKVRRYKNGCSVGVYLRRWSELVSGVERFVPDRVHVARTNNKQVRLWRISTSLTLSSLKGREAGPMIRHTRLRYQCHLMLISHEKHPLASCSSCMRQLFP